MLLLFSKSGLRKLTASKPNELQPYAAKNGQRCLIPCSGFTEWRHLKASTVDRLLKVEKRIEENHEKLNDFD